MKLSHLAFAAALACGAFAAHAQQEPEREHRKPPPEALAACKSLASGAACGFTSPRGEQTGTCAAPEGKPLACRPAHGDKPQGQGSGQGNGQNRGPKDQPKS